MTDSISGLKLYSLGVVVETKPDGSDYILVSPVEELNIQPQGKIRDQTKDFSGNKKGLSGASFKTEHESKNYHRAQWIPFGHSNRITAPDVVVNETVLIFKFDNVDKYYWTTIFREPSLRRLERVLYAYSDLDKGISTEAFDKSSSYWVEASTKDKYLRVHTASSDGEPYEYDIIIDTKVGFMHFRDSIGNFIELNSPKDAITLRANKVINLDAPAVNIRSCNGMAGYNADGVNIAGDRIELDTTVEGRQDTFDFSGIDDCTSVGTGDIERHDYINTYEFDRGYDRTLTDIGTYQYSRLDYNDIKEFIYTTTTDVLTYAKTEERKINGGSE